jgi:cell division protein ZapA (FtsZ GTPase activity inhibitor)
MRSLTEEIDHQLKTGRRTVDRSMGEIQKQFRGADLRRVRVLAAVC